MRTRTPGATARRGQGTAIAAAPEVGWKSSRRHTPVAAFAAAPAESAVVDCDAAAVDRPAAAAKTRRRKPSTVGKTTAPAGRKGQKKGNLPARKSSPGSRGRIEKASGSSGIAPVSVETASPTGTKQDRLRALLGAPGGASLPRLVEALGWQPHTVRAALSRLRKSGHEVERKTGESGSVYRLATSAQG